MALLRGINVGGKGIVAMAELRDALQKCGLENVHTYIQSGNVFFSSPETDKLKLAQLVEDCVLTNFNVPAKAVVFTKDEWQQIIAAAPKWWGKNSEWKHNLLAVIPPYDMSKIIEAVGALKPDIEAIEPDKGVLYQSMSLKLFGRTTTGRLASSSAYKQLTIRNYNTASKLLELF